MPSVNFHDREIYKLSERCKHTYHLYFKALKAKDEKEISRLENELESIKNARQKHVKAIRDILDAESQQS